MVGSAPPTAIFKSRARTTRPDSTGAWKAKAAPAFSASPCSASMNPWLSTIPVTGESSAAVQASAGSIARASAAVSSRMPSTPFASARALIAARRPLSSSDVATISLPQLRCGTPRAAQNS